MSNFLYIFVGVLVFFVTMMFLIKSHDYENDGGIDPIILIIYAFGGFLAGAMWPASLILFGGYLLLLLLSDEINSKYHSRKTSAQTA